MAAKADTWMAFYVGDYVKNTLHLTTRQHGGYLLLILAAWAGEGHLPGSDAALMAIAKLTSKEWKEDGDTLKAFLVRDGDGWIHERVLGEWLEAQSLTDAKRVAGKAGAEKRWHNKRSSKTIADPSDSHRQTDAPSPSQSPNPSHGDTSGDPPRASTPGGARAGASATIDHDSDAQWRARLRNYKPGSFWIENDWGFRPETKGTRVPAHILAEWRARQQEVA